MSTLSPSSISSSESWGTAKTKFVVAPFPVNESKISSSETFGFFSRQLMSLQRLYSFKPDYYEESAFLGDSLSRIDNTIKINIGSPTIKFKITPNSISSSEIWSSTNIVASI